MIPLDRVILEAAQVGFVNAQANADLGVAEQEKIVAHYVRLAVDEALERAARLLDDPDRIARLRAPSAWESITAQCKVIAAILETEAEEIRSLKSKAVRP